MSGWQKLRGGALAALLVWAAACTSILGGFNLESGPSSSSDAGPLGDASGDALQSEDTGTSENVDAQPGDDGGATDAGVDGSCDGSVCAIDVAANANHTCAVLSDGTVYCWGDDTLGQGGPNGPLGGSANEPALVTGIGPAQVLRVGFDFVCALLVDQSVWCWGDDQFSMLGVDGGGTLPDGGAASSVTPVQALPPGSASNLAAGGEHACAKLLSGDVTCWGRNGFGQAGVAKMPNLYPPQVVNVSDVNSVSAGSFETCFARSVVPRGECIGENVYGELGVGPGDAGDAAPTDTLMHPTPLPVDLQTSWGALTQFAHSAGYHMGVVLQSGEVAMWGDNSNGQLGLGVDAGTVSTPMLVPGFGGATQLSLMQYGSCALRVDQTVWCWGSTLYGQTGTAANTGPVQPAPAQVMGLAGVTRIATGFDHVCALLANGNIDCWGWNASGQLGRSTTAAYDPSPAPVRF